MSGYDFGGFKEGSDKSNPDARVPPGGSSPDSSPPPQYRSDDDSSNDSSGQVPASSSPPRGVRRRRERDSDENTRGDGRKRKRRRRDPAATIPSPPSPVHVDPGSGDDDGDDVGEDVLSEAAKTALPASLRAPVDVDHPPLPVDHVPGQPVQSPPVSADQASQESPPAPPVVLYRYENIHTLEKTLNNGRRLTHEARVHHIRTAEFTTRSRFGELLRYVVILDILLSSRKRLLRNVNDILNGVEDDEDDEDFNDPDDDDISDISDLSDDDDHDGDDNKVPTTPPALRSRKSRDRSRILRSITTNLDAFGSARFDLSNTAYRLITADIRSQRVTRITDALNVATTVHDRVSDGLAGAASTGNFSLRLAGEGVDDVVSARVPSDDIKRAESTTTGVRGSRIVGNEREATESAAQNKATDDEPIEWKPHQMLLSDLFTCAGDKMLMRDSTHLYAPVMTKDGHNSGHYKLHTSHEDFLYESVGDQSMFPQNYHTLTSKMSVPPHILHLFARVHNNRVPFYTTDRHLFSFENGIYDVRTNQLNPYGSSGTLRDISGTASVISDRVSTSNYFDLEIVHDDLTVPDPMDIPTPEIDRVLDTQGYSSAEKRTVYFLLGRMLFDINEMDTWSVALYMRGVAGTGKSTLLSLLAELYTTDKVGRMMSDGSATFADEHLLDKNIVIAQDLDDKTTFSLGRFNCFIAGETVSTNRKFKTAVTHTWHAPLAFASNVRPPWKDQAGNVGRRLVIAPFKKVIKKSDMGLFARCKRTLNRFLVKITRLYHQAVHRFGSRSLWDKNILPPLFHSSRKQYLSECNPATLFFESNALEYDQNYEMRLRRLCACANAWAQSGGSKRFDGRINMVSHAHIFGLYNIHIATPPGEDPDDENAKVAYGVRLSAAGRELMSAGDVGRTGLGNPGAAPARPQASRSLLSFVSEQ